MADPRTIRHDVSTDNARGVTGGAGCCCGYPRVSWAVQSGGVACVQVCACKPV